MLLPLIRIRWISSTIFKLLLNFVVIKVKDGTYTVTEDHVIVEFTVVRVGEDLVEEDIPVVLNPDVRQPSNQEIENPDVITRFVEGKTFY